MLSIEQLQTTTIYQCNQSLNLYNSSECEELATQAASDRQFQILGLPQGKGIPIILSEDDYSCWFSIEDIQKIEPALISYQPISVSRGQIEQRINRVISYTNWAMNQPNEYLWGGTIPPHYDCSGLMQAAFASVGVWIPRDAYQQYAFTKPIPVEDITPGDLLFFSSGTGITHVGLCLGEGRYIHSSGKDRGRNRIAIDRLSAQGDTITQYYYSIICGAGRIVAGYISDGNPEAQFECPVSL